MCYTYDVLLLLFDDDEECWLSQGNADDGAECWKFPPHTGADVDEWADVTWCGCCLISF